LLCQQGLALFVAVHAKDHLQVRARPILLRDGGLMVSAPHLLGLVGELPGELGAVLSLEVPDDDLQLVGWQLLQFPCRDFDAFVAGHGCPN
jgi:hypothetical protein